MNKKEIVICLGSSCFSRGNKKLLGLIQSYIQENHYEDSIVFKGAHCCGKCSHGPILKIGEKYFEGLDESMVLEILDKELK